MAHFRKRAITAQERRDLACKHGCKPGGSVTAKCVYCGFHGGINWVQQERGKGWVQFDRLEMDHVIPEFKGGKGGDNLALACRPCNRSKGARTVEEWLSV